MSYVGIIILTVFGANALLSYGFALCPISRNRGLVRLYALLALVLVNALSSGLLWALRGFVLAPLGLESLDLLLFVLVAVPVVRILFRSVSERIPSLAGLGLAADEILVSSIVFGIALVTARAGYSLPEALVASASSAIGYWLAVVALDALRERLELSAIPGPFRGAPAMLISAGLMAMALMGVDAMFVRNVVGP
ncbi:MAG TPA: Rnf-Nqr domain containing protein [Rectinemataceae bacterium]|nr:Rnf-Nqr domain containing protein [Rectinemataceae bacterium]